MSFLYILQSQTTGKFYIGTTDDIDRRVDEHNYGQALSTRHRGPWELVYTEEYQTLGEARKREYQLKSWKSHKAITTLVGQH
ncbi:MAG: GIY-YIG nuclease family protein [Armatimonadota bacterium]